MLRTWCPSVLRFWILLLLVAAARADEPSASPTVAADTNQTSVARLGEEASRAVAEVYAYDATIPLEARTVERRERDGTVREKIVFRGAQGFLVPGYLEFPASASEPLACVLLLHGWSGSKDSWWQDDNYISGGNVRRALLDAGFAVLALDAQCHGDRIAQNDFAPVNHYVDDTAPGKPRKGYFTLQEIYIQTTRDYRRAIDYLDQRSDVDASRIGVVGYSMGAAQAFLLTGVEPRVKTAVAVVAPAEESKWSPVAPQNFIRGIGQRPFLSIVGTSDSLCPLEHALARQSLFEGSDSQLETVDGPHRLPTDYVSRATAWLKEHL